MKLKHKRIAIKVIISVGFLLLLLLVTVIKSNTFIAEYIFARGIGRAWVAFVGSITSFLPFSLYEILYFVLVVVFIYGVVLIIKSQSAKSRLKLNNYIASIMLLASFLLAVYSVTAAPNYYREPIPLEAQFAADDLDAETILLGAEYFVADFNELGRKLRRNERGDVVCPYSRLEFAKIMAAEMARLDDSYYSSFTPYYKNIALSEVLDVMGLAGVFFSPTGEANVSTAQKDCFAPYVIAHELAHSKGVMRENEANLVAGYITLTSQNDYIRYSGYMHLFFGSILNSVVVSHTYELMFEQIYKKVDKQIVQEYTKPSEKSNFEEFLGDFAVKINKLATKMNDFYLKLSGMEEGVGSYNPGRAKELQPIIQGEESIPQYQLTPTQRLIFQIYLDKTA